METKKYTHPDGKIFYQGELTLEQAHLVAAIFVLTGVSTIAAERNINSYEVMSLMMEKEKIYDFLAIVLRGENDAPLTAGQLEALKSFKFTQLTQICADFFTLNPDYAVLFGSIATTAAVLRSLEILKNMKDGSEANSPDLQSKDKSTKTPSVN